MLVKLLQWNILYKEKIENVVKQIKELSPDIICLQELGISCKYNPTIPNTAGYVKEQLGFNCYFQEAQRWRTEDKKDALAIGNGIFTRFPIIKTASHYVQHQTKEFTDYSHERRVYIEAELQLNNKNLTVGTTHLSYIHKFEITNEKKKEVDNLLSVIKNKKENYVFTGDLNSTPTSYTIMELSKYFQNCSPPYDQNTWTTKAFDYQGFKEDKVRWRLDYIFATQDVKCISSEIIQTEYSDHLPILAELEV